MVAKKKSVKRASNNKPLQKKDVRRVKKVHQKKSTRERHVDMTLEAAQVGIWEWYMKTGKVRWSKMVYKLFGVTKKEFKGDISSYRKLIHPDDRETVVQAINETLTNKEIYYIQHRVVWPDGSIKWIEASGNLVWDSKGNPIKLTGTAQDITSKKQFELEKEDWKTRYEIITASSGQVIYDYDLASGRIIWSGLIREVLGYSPNEMDDIVEWIELIHPQDREAVRVKLEEAEKELIVYDITYRIKTKSGDYLTMHDRGIFLTDATGKAYRMLGTMQDITQQQVAEAQLEQSNRLRESIESAMPGVLYVFDLKAQRNVYANRNLAVALGYTTEEIHDLGNDLVRLLVHPDDIVNMPGWTNENFGTVKETQYRMKTKDGNWRWFMGRDTVFQRDEEGNVLQIVGMAQDVTERKKMEEELRESEQRFRTLQQASFGGIGIHDKGMILDCNQGLCDISGYSREELVGSNGLRLIAPEWRDLVMEKILSGYEKPYDVEGERKDGTRFSLEVQAKNIPYQGKMIRVTEFRDITQRKLTEIKIKDQNSKLLAITEDLKRKNEQLEEFTQIVSHNLRSPVGNILTLLSFFETTDKEEEKAEYLSLLKESGFTTQQTLHELNEVLKIKQNKQIPRQELQFEKVLQHVKSMLSAKITEVSAVIESDFSQAPTIVYPNIYLESIFLNLLSNSLKYIHPDRKPEVFFRSFHSNSNIILEVRDNGLGINLERYGHQVFKLHKTFHKHPESRGIGLFMIKNQIETLGGEISIASQVDKGTTIFVNFNKFNVDAGEDSDNSSGG